MIAIPGHWPPRSPARARARSSLPRDCPCPVYASLPTGCLLFVLRFCSSSHHERPGPVVVSFFCRLIFFCVVIYALQRRVNEPCAFLFYALIIIRS